MTHPARIRAGEPADLSFTVRNAAGDRVRFLQFVHERPLHLIVVSADLSDFAHIHPELDPGDAYTVTHTFGHGGRYRLFADYTPPGSGTRIEPFDVTVDGTPARPSATADLGADHTVDGLHVRLAFDHAPRANDDLLMSVSLTDAASGAPVTDLQLYLGALAHFIIVSEDLKDFIHAHPLETGEVYDPSLDSTRMHVHDPAPLAKVIVGPSPSTIRAATSLPRAGRYRMWAQFQRAGAVVTVPLAFDVAPAPRATTRAATPAAAHAITVTVDASGYTPARIDLKQGEPAVLAFRRPRAGNCGGTVVIPALGVRRELPVGETVLIRLSPQRSADIPFTCGMGMMQGLIVVR